MVRSIIGVIVGYVVMVVLQIAAFMTLYAVMGTNWSFKPHSYQASTRWTLAQFVIIALTAVVAGVVCAVIARGGRAPLALAVAVLVLGLIAAVAKTTLRPPDKTELRMGSLTQVEAMNKAWQPTWVLFLGPLVGAAGVVIGGKLKRRS
jgi:small-conductance mechanosensitive channel